ncbi:MULTISPECIES: hypothetical protein [Clostridia]|uniref:hypothetical protein n=1 Tax=Clostridium sp. CCUG 7971 TaxID=2811414 RepID=UPI001ABAC7D5|nr:hypothetical protein [Clostridium sp. CCUG 7971]MBO3443595.1 hypothetical protein [Clostridium sp. CCUG 7971]
MLDRLFGGCDCAGGIWIIVLFFLFLVFQDTWAEFDICDWIPFLILLLIVCGMGGIFDDGCGC